MILFPADGFSPECLALIFLFSLFLFTYFLGVPNFPLGVICVILLICTFSQDINTGNHFELVPHSVVNHAALADDAGLKISKELPSVAK